MPKYTYKGKAYDVPEDKVEGFLSRKPEAQPLDAGAPIMTAAGIGTPKTAPLTPRESDIRSEQEQLPTGNAPAQPYSPNTGGIATFSDGAGHIPSLKHPSVGEVDTKLSTESLYTPKSNIQIARDAADNSPEVQKARSVARFDADIQRYKSSDGYVPATGDSVSLKGLPLDALEWLDKNKVVVRPGLNNKAVEGEMTYMDTMGNTPEQIALVRGFLSSTPEGQSYEQRQKEREKWLDEQIGALEARVADADKNRPIVKVKQGNSLLAGDALLDAFLPEVEVQEYDQDVALAKRQLKELKRQRDAIEDGDRSVVAQFGREIGRRAGVGLTNAGTLGIAKPLEGAITGAALRDPENKLTREASDLLGQYESLHANDRSIAQDIARGSYDSAAFMAQMLATGGIGSALTEGAATIIANRLGGSLAAKAIGKLGEVGGRALVQTAISPSTLAGAYEMNMRDPGSFLNDYAQMFKQNYVEYFSEIIGGVVPGARTMGAKTKFGQILGKVSERTGIQDIGTEFFEEQLATAGHIAADDGQAQWDDFVDVRNQLVTLGSVALMQMPNQILAAGGYAAGKARNIRATRSIRKGYENNVNNMAALFGDNVGETTSLIDEKIDADPTAIFSIVHAAAMDDTMTDVEEDAIVKYAYARAAYSGLEKAKTEEIETATQAVPALVQENINPQMNAMVSVKMAGSENPVQIVGGNIVQREDGTIDAERSDNEIFYVDADGNRQVAPVSMVEGMIENIPVEEATVQITTALTAPIIARQENDEVREYTPGEPVRVQIGQQEMVGEITEVSQDGNYTFMSADGAQIEIEPRQIVNEDNLIGVENGTSASYIKNGTRVDGIVATSPDLYLSGVVGFENGDVVPIKDVIGPTQSTLATSGQTSATIQGDIPPSGTTGDQAPVAEISPEGQIAGGDMPTEQSGTQAADIEAIITNAPKQKDGAVDYDALMESDPEGFATLYESEEGAEETQSELKTVSGNIGKQITYAQKQLDGADSINKRKAARAKIASLTDKQARIDRIISERYSIPTAEFTGVNTPVGTVVEDVDARVENPSEEQARRERRRKNTPFENRLQATIDLASGNLRARILYGIASGEFKFQWRDSANSPGLARELGLVGSEPERRARIGIISNEGYTPETLAEAMRDDTMLANTEALDAFETRDEILDILKSVYSRKQALDALEAMADDGNSLADMDEDDIVAYESEQIRQRQVYQEEIFEQLAAQDVENLLTFAEEMGMTVDQLNDIHTYSDLVEQIILLENGSIEDENSTDNGEAERPTPNRQDILTRREGASAEADRAVGGSENRLATTEPAVGEPDGSAEEGGDRASDRDSAEDNANLTEDEQRIVTDASAAFDAEVADAEARLRQRRADLSAARNRIGQAYTADNQTSLLPQGETATPGNLFNVPRDYSRENVEDILVPIQQDIDALADDLTALTGSRDSRIQSALDNFRSQPTILDAIAQAEAETNTNPTEAQKLAGNYKMGHVKVQGFDISIENPKGSVRSGVDENGREWSQEMHNSYGYFGKTKSKDNDHVDVFLGDNPESGTLFVVDQVNPATGQFDEHKVMLGFNTIDEARDAYLSNYEDGWQGLGSITETDTETFRTWAQADGRRVKPFAEYRAIQDVQAQSTAERFRPITESKFDRLIELLRQTRLAKDVITDPVQFREALTAILGEQDASRFLSLWHGSPATFKKFSSAFIGTGEGAQAFGYGLYFTSRRDISEWYAEKLKPAKYRENAIINDLARESLKMNDGNVEAAIAYEKSFLENSFADKKRTKGIIKILETGKFLSEGKSNVYKVEIGDNLNFIQWDRSLTDEQISAIKRQAQEENISDRWGHHINDEGYYPDSMPFSVGVTGEAAYEQLTSEFFNSPAETSAFLERAGIDGVRYPAASGSAPTVNRSGENYVIFDDNAVQIVSKLRMMATPKGDVYGFVTPDGKVYIDGSRMNANTPIHEFGHLWNSMIKESNPELWARGSALIRESDYWRQVNDNPAYRDLSDARKVDEALAMAIGNKGEDAFNNGDVVAYAGLKGWLYQAWEWIKSKLGITRSTNIEDMTLGDFTDLAVRELLGGENLRNSSENSNFVNENDSENGTGTETGVDNRQAMVGSALRSLVGEKSQARGIYSTVKAADLGGIDGAVREAEEIDELESRGINPYFSKPNFRKALTEAAKGNGVWLDASYLDGKELMHDQKARGTSENDVYKNPDGKTLTKLNNLSYVTGSEFDRNLGAVVDRLSAHNALFPEVAYEIKGFMANKNGFPALVLEQLEVDAERNATQEEIDNYLASHGFALSGTRNWSNEHPVWSNGVYELFDARPANVLMGRDGNLYFIDTIPHSVEYMSGAQSSETISRQEVSEMEQIRQRAVADGTFMKAPNGQPTNLTERQWLQVRTSNFKNWFGDWEKATRIEKLRNSSPVEITGEEVTPSEDLKEYKANALEYGKSLRGSYVNSDTGETINVGAQALKEVLRHDGGSVAHIQSVAAIPAILENGIYIDTVENESQSTKPNIRSYDYYVVGLKIGGVDYTVKAAVANDRDGTRYYDHALTQIEKTNLLDEVEGVTSPTRQKGDSVLLSEVKDKRLISILQTNSSKIVDENGEPRVVAHSTNREFTEFKNKQENDSGWLGAGYYFFGDRSLDGEYGKNVMQAFLNVREPYNIAYDEVRRLADSNDATESRDFTRDLIGDGYDGVYFNGNLNQEIAVFNPNQIKSATDNTGEFSADNNDIRLQFIGEKGAAAWDKIEEANTRLDNLAIAREMENTGKDAKSIKIATGWERGADGKWRYEIEDYERGIRIFGGGKHKLSEVAENKKLFAAYPQLKDMEVDFHGELSSLKGSYDNGRIFINLRHGDLKPTVVHEIQHAIQDIEGFARGDNPRRIEITHNTEAHKKWSDTLTAIRYVQEYGANNTSSSAYSSLSDFAKHQINSVRRMKPENAVVKLQKQADEFEAQSNTKTEIGLDRYYNSAGEVEARNTANRTEMSSIWRKISLAESTEDVAREDQIVIFDAANSAGEFLNSSNDVRFQSISQVADAVGSTMTNDVREELDRRLDNFKFRLREAWEDQHLAVKRFFDTLRSRGAETSEHNDYYQKVTALSGKNQAQLKVYGKQYQEPLNDILGMLEDMGFEFREIENYVILKHGLERNTWMGKHAKGRAREDYSGITAVEKEVGMKAQEYIDWFEQRAGQKNIENLWDRIRAATSFSLKKQLEAGLISRELYDDLLNRYKYYVPLRGHDVDTAADKYDYDFNMDTYFVAPLKRAKGRISRSESPFAYIYNMAQSAINSSNRNILNQTILRLARTDKTGLMSVSKAWYVQSGQNEDGTPTYEVQAPTYSEDPEQYQDNIEAFEARMKELEAAGQAKQVRSKLDLGGLFITRSQAKQHEVHVFQNGTEYIVYINANPAVADAINGTNVKDPPEVLQLLANVTRQMAANFTTRNPIFVLSNFSRDYIYSSSILAVKEDASYALQFQKNLLASTSALQRYVRGKVDLSKEQDTYLSEYMMNGAKTGISHLLDLQSTQRNIERDIRRGQRKTPYDRSIGPVLNALEAMNEMAENMSRLSVYITSRKQGRSISQSVSDAKEVTVNFNRRGAGGMGARYVRPLYLFVNAAIQALANFLKVAAKNKGKAAILLASYTLSAALMPYIALFFGGEDGYDEYMKLGDWERQNNLCIYTGSGFIKIPLPQELRVFHRMGDNVFQAIFENKDWLETLGDTLSGFADILPLNPLGAIDGNWADIMPDGIKPLFQWGTNRTFTGSRITNEWADSNKPGYLRVRTNKKGEPYAPAFLIKLAEGLDDMTGGDGVKKGVISLNPDVVNHLMRGYFGGLYTMASQGLNIADKTIEVTQTGEFNLKVRDTPLRTFFTSSDDLQISGSGLQSRYFKISDDIKETLRRAKGYQEQVSEGEIGVIEYGEKIRGLDIQRANEVNEVIKRIGKYEDALKDFDGEKQKELEREIANLKGRVIELYSE